MCCPHRCTLIDPRAPKLSRVQHTALARLQTEHASQISLALLPSSAQRAGSGELGRSTADGQQEAEVLGLQQLDLNTGGVDELHSAVYVTEGPELNGAECRNAQPEIARCSPEVPSIGGLDAEASRSGQLETKNGEHGGWELGTREPGCGVLPNHVQVGVCCASICSNCFAHGLGSSPASSCGLKSSLQGADQLGNG